MPLTPFTVDELAEGVLGCVCAALDQAATDIPGRPGCPCRACLVPGTPAWDSCDAEAQGSCGETGDVPGEAGGQLTVHVARIYPADRDTFPAQDSPVQGVRGCGPPPITAVELVVTLLRCAPTMDETGCPPTCEELRESARVLHVDAVTVYNALWCCLPGLGRGRRGLMYMVGGQRTVGPEGGCVGLEQRVTVALPGCAPCPEGEGAS